MCHINTYTLSEHITYARDISKLYLQCFPQSFVKRLFTVVASATSLGRLPALPEKRAAAGLCSALYILIHLYPPSHIQETTGFVSLLQLNVILASCRHRPLKRDFLYLKKGCWVFSPVVVWRRSLFASKKRKFFFSFFFFASGYLLLTESLGMCGLIICITGAWQSIVSAVSMDCERDLL